MNLALMFCLELRVKMLGHVKFALRGTRFLIIYAFKSVARGYHIPHILNGKWGRYIYIYNVTLFIKINLKQLAKIGLEH